MEQLDKLLYIQGGRCFFCRKVMTKDEATVEHLVAIANAGGNGEDNTVACCKSLNQLLGSRSLKEKLHILLAQGSNFSCPPVGVRLLDTGYPAKSVASVTVVSGKQKKGKSAGCKKSKPKGKPLTHGGHKTVPTNVVPISSVQADASGLDVMRTIALVVKDPRLAQSASPKRRLSFCNHLLASSLLKSAGLTTRDHASVVYEKMINLGLLVEHNGNLVYRFDQSRLAKVLAVDQHICMTNA